jgi:glycosyltransferase involved in cell wall biosynthesis
MLRQLWWERFDLPKALKATDCNVLFNVDAASVCPFRPAVTMSQDMLSFEFGEMQRYGYGQARLRLLVLKYVQNAALRTAAGAIFLTHYAGEVIQRSCGVLSRIAYIPHGVSESFRVTEKINDNPVQYTRSIRCLYVSNISPYKHQWHVVRAIKMLRDRGFDLQLTLTGGGQAGGVSNSEARLYQELALSDPERSFVKLLGFVNHVELPNLLLQADIFVFASSCENMPITLVEAMAIGLPIACSNRGPMPEVLADGGIYFDPERPDEIATAIQTIILDSRLRIQLARRAYTLASQYSWARCAHETLGFLSEIADES